MLEIDETSLKPVIVSEDGACFLYKQINNITILAVTKNNVNAAMVYSFIYR